MRLLVVDFDYFVPVIERPQDGDTWPLYDWGHSEAYGNGLQSALWDIRAMGFLRHGYNLPTTSGEEVNFWSRFDIKPNAPFYVADSNVHAYAPRVRRGVTDVWLYDAHHDCGYKQKLSDIFMSGKLSCEDWMIGYWLAGAKLHVRYPKWRRYAMTLEPKPNLQYKLDRKVDNGDDLPLRFDKVFVCRSGAWVPPWLDMDFVKFILRSGLPMPKKLDEVKMRKWSLDSVLELMETEAKMLQKANELQK